MNRVCCQDLPGCLVEMMNLLVNGNAYRFSRETLADLIEDMRLSGRRIAVEVNQVIVPRSEHGEYRLAEGDTVEIVHAIGGG